jgi:hypothetical protein
MVCGTVVDKFAQLMGPIRVLKYGVSVGYVLLKANTTHPEQFALQYINLV